MRGRSSKQGSKGGLNIDKVDKIKEPNLSGAYIRSLVKQLTSTRTKDPLNSKEQEALDAEGGLSSHQNLTKTSDGLNSETQQSQPPPLPLPPPPPQQHKKQVRRRLHTSRPYQERLLNMAEARREIVTALKFHRASMKQAHDQQQQQQQQEKQQDTDMETSRQTLQQQQPMEQERGKSKSRRNPRIYASNNNTSNNFTNYVDNFSYPAFTYPPNYSNPYPSWPLPPIPPPPLLLPENLNFPLPNQTLGLNLNLQEFSNLDSNFYHYADNQNSSPSPSSSSSPQVVQVSTQGVPNPTTTTTPEQERVPIMAIPNEESVMVESENLGLHHAMDDKEMAEIRSIGEQHQMEWNDTINLVTSAWWFKFLKTMEIDPEEKKIEEFGNFPFHEQVMEFPSWLNANDDEDGCFLEQQHLSSNYYCSDDYMQDPALPW